MGCWVSKTDESFNIRFSKWNPNSGTDLVLKKLCNKVHPTLFINSPRSYFTKFNQPKKFLKGLARDNATRFFTQLNGFILHSWCRRIITRKRQYSQCFKVAAGIVPRVKICAAIFYAMANFLLLNTTRCQRGSGQETRWHPSRARWNTCGMSATSVVWNPKAARIRYGRLKRFYFSEVSWSRFYATIFGQQLDPFYDSHASAEMTRLFLVFGILKKSLWPPGARLGFCS